MEDEGVVSQRGLFALSQGCPKLEYLAVYRVFAFGCNLLGTWIPVVHFKCSAER